jgi:hypothetical protein
MVEPNLVGFEVPTAVSTNICLLGALMMEAARTSETLIVFYQTTRRWGRAKQLFFQTVSRIPIPEI